MDKLDHENKYKNVMTELGVYFHNDKFIDVMNELENKLSDPVKIFLLMKFEEDPYYTKTIDAMLKSFFAYLKNNDFNLIHLYL